MIDFSPSRQPNPDDTQPITPIKPSAPTRLWVLWVLSGVGVLMVLAGLVVGGLLSLTGRGQAVGVTVIVNGEAVQVQTTRATVRELLNDEGIEISAGAAIQPPVHAPITPDMTITITRGRTIHLTVDGMTSVYRTLNEYPADILADAGVVITADDVLMINGTRIEPAQLADYPLPANRISVTRARDVTILFEGSDEPAQTFRTTAQDVGDALAEAGITLFVGDDVSAPLSAAIHEGDTLTITRSLAVTIISDGISTETRAQAGTVGDVLAQNGVFLSGLDYSIPPENARLSDGMQVRVIRVTEDVLVEQIAVPFESVYQADDTLELDQRRTLQAGVAGVDQRTIRVRYENGAEVRRTDEGITRIQEPQNQVVGYGTQIVIRTLDTPDGNIEYWRVTRMYATSYHPGSVGGNTGTSIGRTLTKGIVAIDPRVVPYNTRLYVQGYGLGEAADTGGPRSHRYWIDLGYDDENWVGWSRWVDVYWVTPVPANVAYILP